jgi:tripartite motif-containing protein 71
LIKDEISYFSVINSHPALKLSNISSFTLVLAYNQPELCSSASWNANGTTFADSSFVGIQPFGIFVSSNNTIYVGDRTSNLIQIWNQQINIPFMSITGSFTGAYSLFVTTNDDVYIDDGINGQIYQWITNGTSNVLPMTTSGYCYSLFVDVYNACYCCMHDYHQVLKISLNGNQTTSTLVAGTGSPGSSANTLNGPQGIFVDINLDLYVADCSNNRIQLFHFGQMNGTTVVGNGSITLTCPTGVALDAANYLYIVDNNNHRIIRYANNISQCILGCSGSSGSASDQLNYPQSLAFDSFGNLFVVDKDNTRIQKFLFEPNSCGECINSLWN